MEDIVKEILEDILKDKKDICQCEQCKMDMVCFALNKILPKYVVSSRGIIHTEKNRISESQSYADVYSIVMEAINTVSNTKRHEENKIISIETPLEKEYSEKKYYFNFPQIVGKVIDSLTLAPISDAKIELCYTDNKIVEMFNKTWDNPIELIDKMEGIFTFWPAPLQTEKLEDKDFDFILKIYKKGYENLTKSFSIKIKSKNEINKVIKKENIFYLPDIYLYIKENDEEQNNSEVISIDELN